MSINGIPIEAIVVLWLIGGLVSWLLFPVLWLYLNVSNDGFKAPDRITMEVFRECYSLKNILKEIPMLALMGWFSLVVFAVMGVMATVSGVFTLYDNAIDEVFKRKR